VAVTAFDTFSVHFSRDGGTVVVHATGDLDVASAPQLADALVDVIDDQGSLSVRIDLRGVTFIDSTGLSLLVDALHRVGEKGGTLMLAHPGPSLRRLFGIVGFTQRFPILG
jgi:anti-sigma B factor antagonist